MESTGTTMCFTFRGDWNNENNRRYVSLMAAEKLGEKLIRFRYERPINKYKPPWEDTAHLLTTH